MIHPPLLRTLATSMALASSPAGWDAAAGTWAGAAASRGVDFDRLPSPLYIFGYASLCWKAGDALEGCETDVVEVAGWRRSFSQRSTDHRGTPEAPGLVATVLPDVAAACVGLAYKVPVGRETAVLEDLEFREKGGYTSQLVGCTAVGGGPVLYEALVFAASADNPNYEDVSVEEAGRIIARSVGPSGPNDAYLLNLGDWLREVGADDPHVTALEGALRVARAGAGGED